MSTLHGIVREGRLVVEEKLDYPDGTELKLQVVDGHDDFDLTDEEWSELEETVLRGVAEAKAGLGRPAREYLAELLSRP